MTLKFRAFTGLNNQLRSRELTLDDKSGTCALVMASNIDLDLNGKPRRRKGVTPADDGAWRSLWEDDALDLGVRDGDLVNVNTGDVLRAGVGATPRMWYSPWPDGRVAFSNGSYKGITDGTIAGTTGWGITLPATVGTPSATGGSLFPGTYKYALTYVRIADGLEGGPSYGSTIELTANDGGVIWSGLPPPPAGHRTNVYLTSHNDDVLYLAATTTTTAASFTGANVDLITALKSHNCYPAPAGICLGFWRGRSLLATGNLLIASRSQQWELFDLSRDVKAFPANVTMVLPVDDGIWIGTEGELCFLGGQSWDELQAAHDVVAGPVALGSGVPIEASVVGDGEHKGPAGVCIAGGYVTACFNGGTASILTDKIYRAEGTEYAAAFRMQGEIPQYVAIEQ